MNRAILNEYLPRYRDGFRGAFWPVDTNQAFANLLKLLDAAGRA